MLNEIKNSSDIQFTINELKKRNVWLSKKEFKELEDYLLENDVDFYDRLTKEKDGNDYKCHLEN